MYKDRGGECVELQGIKCYLPPVPPIHEIYGSNLPKADQKWIPTPLPKFRASEIEIFSGTKYRPNELLSWDEVVREEIIKNSGHDPWNVDRNGREKRVDGVEPDLEYRMPCLSKFRKQELERLQNGFWFMNNGVPTYLTNIGYMYFNWWKMDIGLPQYRRYIREILYVVEYALENPMVLGIILASMRGVGKTYLATCILYTIMMFKRNALGGMQSKTDDDGDSMYEKKLCQAVLELPDFLVPIHDWKNVIPNNKMSFDVGVRQHPNREYDRLLRKLALRSVIDHRNASNRAYDGETTTVLLQDEIGKISKKAGNVISRFNVVRDCVFRGSTKRGIVFGFTTVGNMEKEGGNEFKELFKNADQRKLDELGYTHNNFISYFISALESTVFDEYGDPVIEPTKSKRTIEYIANDPLQGPQFTRGSRFFHETQKNKLFEEGNAKGDLTDYIDYCQNHPFTLNDAFSFSGKECIFNLSVLQTAQHRINSTPPERVRRSGYFEWEIKDKKVRWVDDTMNPRCHVSFFPDGKVWKANNISSWTDVDGKTYFHPTNDHLASAGFDPFSHRDVVDKARASKAAYTLRTRFNFHFGDEYSDTPIVHYKFRANDPYQSFEDIIMICFFFGTQVLIENAKGGVNAINHFEQRGYGKFVMRRPQATFTRKDNAQDTPGMPMSPGVIEQYSNLAAKDITNHGHKFKHIEIVEDALDFDPTNTEKFDSFVSYGLSLIAAEKKYDEKKEPFELGTVLTRY